MPKHTPGPWTADWDGDEDCGAQDRVWRILAPPGYGCILADGIGHQDASLIAAAPDLLAAAEAAEPYVCGLGSAGALAQLRAAIARAKGDK